MNESTPAIVRILIATAASQTGNAAGPLSIGILTDKGGAFWGDFPSSDTTVDQLATVERLVDLSQSKLQGRPLSGFRALWDIARPIFPERGRVPIADGVGGAIQQAMLAAVAATRHCTVAELLSAEFNLHHTDSQSRNLQVSNPSLYLEISDHAATAARIDAMLALRPVGLGYRLTGGRVAEALGENAEYLQRFVRELGQRAELLASGTPYQPAIYLGLNGALGRLAGDPVRHLGKVLGNSIGLQEAAGPRQLILEDPFLLDDSTRQASNLLRLNDFIRRTPSSHDRTEPTLLASNGSNFEQGDLTIYSDIQPVNAMTFDLVSMGDINWLMTYLTQLSTARIGTFIRLEGWATYRWIETAVDIAMAAGPLGLILNCDSDFDSSYGAIFRRMNETSVAATLQTPQQND